MLLVNFLHPLWVYSLQESYDQHGNQVVDYITILIKRPRVKKSLQGLLIYCFQVGNFLIHISREREKNPWVLGKQIKVDSHCGMWDVGC